jgi:hypothetical protein
MAAALYSRGNQGKPEDLMKITRFVPAPDGGSGGGTVTVTAEKIESIAPYEVVRKMRASVCVLGPLLAKRETILLALEFSTPSSAATSLVSKRGCPKASILPSASIRVIKPPLSE